MRSEKIYQVFVCSHAENKYWGKAPMARRKLFGKSKQKKADTAKEIDIGIVEDGKTLQQDDDTKQENIEEENLEEDSESEQQPIKEYHETFYSRDHPSMNNQKSWRRHRWENATIIERNVDSFDEHNTDHASSSECSDDIDRKVDRLFSAKGVKKGKKTKKKKDEKPAVPDGYVEKVNKRTGLTYYQKK